MGFYFENKYLNGFLCRATVGPAHISLKSSPRHLNAWKLTNRVLHLKQVVKEWEEIGGANNNRESILVLVTDDVKVINAENKNQRIEDDTDLTSFPVLFARSAPNQS